MEIFRSRTADGVWCQAYEAVMAMAAHAKQPSRIGETLELLHVALEIDDPRQRWVISRRPAMNPAFAIAEALWILAGKNDADVMNYWFPNLPRFAGNGPTYAGAYGHRLRNHFGIDQVKRACDALSSDSRSRQVVLQFWDVLTDLPQTDGVPRSSDVPCNVISMLKVRNGRLEWSQVLRSNDIHRGLPNNLVQFTMLQEIMAGWLCIELGGYNQWSDSLHIYVDALHEFSCSVPMAEATNTDSLAMPADRGGQLLQEMYQRMSMLTLSELSETQITDIATIGDAPVGYRNLLRVLAADSTRRRGNLEQAHALMEECTNSQLIQVWSAWVERVQGTTARQSRFESSRGRT